MSAERKTVEEKLKKDKETIPLKELTLGEVGMEIPPELAGPTLWRNTDGINTIKVITVNGKRFGQTILCAALLHGYYHYALELINTYNRKDKIGLNPNIPGTRTTRGTLCFITPMHILIEETISDSIGSASSILVDALIKAGFIFSYVKYMENFKVNSRKWGYSEMLLSADGYPAPLNFLIHDASLFHYWRRDWTGNMDIPSHILMKPFLTKKVCAYLQFLTEDLVEDRPVIQEKDEFVKLIDETILAGQKMPQVIYNLIFDYLPFYPKTPVNQKTPLKEIYNPFELQKAWPDPARTEIFLKKLKTFLNEQYENYRKEQRELQKAEYDRIDKKDKEEAAEMAKRQKDIEIQQLNTRVAKLSDQLDQQNKMLQMQSKQMAQLTFLLQKFMGGSDKLLQGPGASAALSAFPKSDHVPDLFEIASVKFH